MKDGLWRLFNIFYNAGFATFMFWHALHPQNYFFTADVNQVLSLFSGVVFTALTAISAMRD